MTTVKGKILRGDLALYDGKNALENRRDSTGGTLSGLPVHDYVDVLQVYGDGDSYSSSTINEAINALGSRSRTIHFAVGTWTISTDVTVPSNLTSYIPAGCVFDVASGVTLTFSGPLALESETFTSGSGTVSYGLSLPIPYKHGGSTGTFTTGATAIDVQTRLDQQIFVADFLPDGHVTDGSVDYGTEIAAALTAAAGKQLIFPAYTVLCGTELSISTDYTDIIGQGPGSHLKMTGAKILYDAETKGTHIFGCNIRDIQLSRVGTAGPVVEMKGKNSMGVARWQWVNVRITDSTGVGHKMAGAWIWEQFGTVITSCASYGVEIALATDGNSSVNAGRYFGGEIQGGSDWGVYGEGVSGLSFFGTSIEGNSGGGVNARNNMRNLGFYNCYFELNGTTSGLRDLTVGDTSYSGTKVTSRGLVVNGCVFWDGSGAAKDYAIELSRSFDAEITNTQFNAYATGGINNNEEAAGTVTGYYKSCNSTVGSVATDTDTFYSDLQQGVLTLSSTHDFGSISAGSTASQDFTVTGAAVGDLVIVSSGANLQGMTITGHVSGANTVKITINNNTAGAIDPANATYRIVVIPPKLFGLN